MTLSYEQAASILAYRLNGTLVWLVNASSRAKAGLTAGKLGSRGYIQVGFRGRLYQAHRIVWLLHYKEWPPLQINHINGRKNDNRIENLELATQRENTLHAYRTGLVPPKPKKRAKLTPEDVQSIRSDNASNNALAIRFGVCATHIGRIRRGLTHRTFQQKEITA